jgi:MFS family permease
MQGFDNVANSEIISMIAFTKQFGVENKNDVGTYFIPSRWLGGWQGAMQAGSAIGAFSAGYLMDRIGRKKTILIACSISCVGVGVQYASHDWQVYLAGKFVNGKQSDLCPRRTPQLTRYQGSPSACGSLWLPPGSAKMPVRNVEACSFACTTAPSSSARLLWRMYG